MSVTHAEAGTMTETEERSKVSSSAEAKTPDDAKEVSSTKPEDPRFTEADVKAAVHAARSEAGRESAVIESERNSLKAELAKVRSEFEENQQEIARFEELIKDDPERLDVVKELKSLKQERRTLQSDREALQQERAQYAERVKLAEDTMREIVIFDLAQEYDGGDPQKLKDLADTFGANTEAQFRAVAEKLWTKKLATPEKPKGKPFLKLDSGGSGGALSDAQIIAAFTKDPYNPENKQRYYELRAKRSNY